MWVGSMLANIYIYGAVEKTMLLTFKRKTLQVGILVVHYSQI